ncbi:MAG: hypothetical protein K8T25_14675 [Planctomycetia bacterium]|nr:hypothetical protein [Planctomycetia bacterium]
MKRCSVVLAAAVAVVLSAISGAQAQRPGGGGGGGRGPGMSPVGLLSQKSVQEELKLTADQVSEVTKLAEKQRAARGAGGQDLSREERMKQYQERAKATETAVAGILKPEQVSRLKQITLQVRGAMSFSSPEVAEALKLTDEQKGKVKTIQDDLMKEVREAFTGEDRAASRTKVEAARKAATEKLTALLTAEQSDAWKKMTGEPFKGEIRQPERGRGGRAPRGGASGGPPPDQA